MEDDEEWEEVRNKLIMLGQTWKVKISRNLLFKKNL